MSIYFLENEIQTYDWGSPNWIPELLGIDNPAGTPMAEIWMGVHPKAPSKVRMGSDSAPLDEFISKAPDRILGPSASKKFSGKLPFLFKVLAAGKPLSIQAHPNKSQAEAGFDRENEKGVPIDAYERNYRDQNHKPEIICALTDFHAMRGFRPAAEIVEEFRFIFSGAEHPFHIPGAEGGELEQFFDSFLSVPAEHVETLIARALEKIKSRKETRYEWVRRLSEHYPEDIGVLCPLFLNLAVLHRGDAMFLPAGELHAYLHGLGIELMANSDNVLRGGLTSKHVAKEELLNILTFQAGKPEILAPRRQSENPAESVYLTPIDEFRLSTVEIDTEAYFYGSEERNIEIYFCEQGSGSITADNGGADMGASSGAFTKGNSWLVPASAGRYAIHGNAKLYKATVP